MRVVIPYTRQYHPLARKSHLRIDNAELVDVSGDENNYHRLLERLWSDGESFLLIEHDIEQTDIALEEARTCECLWGASPYVIGEGGNLWSRALGFTRFRAELMAREPDLMVAAGRSRPQDVSGSADWRILDSRIDGILRARHYDVCVHSPVVHHHIYGGVCVCGTDHPDFKVDQEGRYII